MLSSCCALLLKWTITKFHSNTTCNINYALHQHVSTHIVITRLCIKHTGCIKMTGVVWKSIIFTSMVKILINTSTNERVTLQVYDRYLQMFTFFGPRRKDCLTRSTLSSDTRGRPALFPLQRHPVVWNCWHQRLMLLGDGGSLLNCRRNARWTETTDSCFTNCSTQNTFCSGVAIIALLRHRPREKRGVGLRMLRKPEHLLFRSMWETYFCVRFDSRNGGLKSLQSIWYTHCNEICCSSLWPFVRKVDVLRSDRVCWLPSLESAAAVKHRLTYKNQTKI